MLFKILVLITVLTSPPTSRGLISNDGFKSMQLCMQQLEVDRAEVTANIIEHFKKEGLDEDKVRVEMKCELEKAQ